ncbi:MAG TPA: cytidylate kinase family protein [Candidatus Paceibacterota bacterium]|jgi:cytidylate kinase
MKKSIITIAGELGSGKSSTAKRIAAELGYEHFSSGDLFRAVADERGLSLEEANRQAEQEPSIDFAVDDRLKKLGEQDRLVVDSRLAFHWIPSSFKVFLALDPEMAAERIFNHIQKEGRVGESGNSVDEILRSIVSRRESERKRYMTLYGVDTLDLSAFDLTTDTSNTSLDNVAEKVKTSYQSWLAKD